jgi:hypothetical protein
LSEILGNNNIKSNLSKRCIAAYRFVVTSFKSAFGDRISIAETVSYGVASVKLMIPILLPGIYLHLLK